VASGTAVELSDATGLRTATPEISVVVPAFNEAGGIDHDLRGILDALASQDASYEVIVVDDGSEDDTAVVASAVDGVRVVQHPRNRGYGAALKTGIRHARGDVIVITDADGTYPPEQIPMLVEQLEGADMVVGARIGRDVKIPAVRRPAKWLLNKLASLLAEANIPDLNSGLRVFDKQAAIRFMSLLPSGFSFTSTITLASKIKPIKDTYNFFLLVFRILCYFNPLKVFMPPAFLLMGLGTAKLIYDIVVENNIFQGEILAILVGLQLGAFGLLADAVSKLRATVSERE